MSKTKLKIKVTQIRKNEETNTKITLVTVTKKINETHNIPCIDIFLPMHIIQRFKSGKVTFNSSYAVLNSTRIFLRLFFLDLTK